VAVGRTAMFRLPHPAPLSRDSGAREGITTDSSDSTTLWIGSYYGGVVIDTRTRPASPKIPANMVVVINADGKTSQYTSNQISPDVLKLWLKK
jgi:ligand-binding sensor domain-containing protein